MKKEFICMFEDMYYTMQELNAAIKDGYQIEIISQNGFQTLEGEYIIFTSLWRWKEDKGETNDSNICYG